MAGRRLGPDEQALWGKVVESVRPLFGRPRPDSSAAKPTPFVLSLSKDVPNSAAPVARPSTALRTNGRVGETLDGGWDRRLRRGVIEPDMTVDLHGHTLATAHAALDHALARALAGDTRVILLVTGKPPREDASGKRRGLIRASLGRVNFARILLTGVLNGPMAWEHFTTGVPSRVGTQTTSAL